VTRLSPEEAASQRRERLEALQHKLVGEVDKLTTSEGWNRMLQMSAKLHGYSLRNQLLIAAQRPEATAIAGYRAWQRLGRQVQPGQHGIQILAPLRGKREAEDRDTGETIAVPTIRGFRIATVFDIEQTDGEPLPGLGPKRLEGEAPRELWDRVVILFAEDGYTVTRDVPRNPGANGEIVPAAHQVRIRPDLGPLQALKTLLHERAHLSLGHTDDLTSYRSHRGDAEIEAESVAFVVAGSWGLDTSAYSVGYVAHWAEGDLDKITKTAERVVSAAHDTIERLSPTPALDLSTQIEPSTIGVEL
jgi:antirestriction protein ArdC